MQKYIIACKTAEINSYFFFFFKIAYRKGTAAKITGR